MKGGIDIKTPQSKLDANAAYSKRTNYKAQKDYLKSKTKTYSVTLTYANDSDLIIHMESIKNRASYLRGLIRKDTESSEGVLNQKNGRVIPFLSTSVAAGPAEPESNLSIGTYTVDEDSNAEFAFRVYGDSMEPYLPDGSIQFGQKIVPKDGEVGVFMVNGEYLVKQYCCDIFGNVYLFSLNRQRSDADRVLYTSGNDRLDCFGKVIMERVPLPK